MNINPLVSVSIETYNHVNYIKACLDSVLMQQTDFEFEIILGEDASTDGTREICIEYAERHPDKIRLFLHHRDNNISIGGKPSGRFNLLYNLSKVRGKYIARCEGDDYWTDPLKLQKQVDFLEADENCFMINHAMPHLMNSNEGWYDFERFCKAGYLPHTSNFMIRKFDLNKYKNALLNFLGAETCLEYIAVKEGQIYHSEEVVSYYRISGTGIYTSLSQEDKAIGEIRQLEIADKYFNIPPQIYHKKMFNRLDQLYKINSIYSLRYVLYRTYFIPKLFLIKVKDKIKLMIS
ncbi:MAG: glycosyltransferase family 2 protein [Flavobacteriales bacterium]|nr:glycosyltransferase family 2 protein [Flavobacteriales bacterium]